MSVPEITGTIEPVAKLLRESNELKVTDLPFVKDLGKGKDKRRSFWHVKPTGEDIADIAIGKAYAVELIQYVLNNPDINRYAATWVIFEAVKKEPKSYIEFTFLREVISLTILGAQYTVARQSRSA